MSVSSWSTAQSQLCHTMSTTTSHTSQFLLHALPSAPFFSVYMLLAVVLYLLICVCSLFHMSEPIQVPVILFSNTHFMAFSQMTRFHHFHRQIVLHISVSVCTVHIYIYTSFLYLGIWIILDILLPFLSYCDNDFS